MMLRREAITSSWALALTMAACGTRSPLDHASSTSGGAGGASTVSSTASTSSSSSTSITTSTSSSNSTSSTSSGSGGAPPMCTTLVLSGERITYEATPGVDGSHPALVSAAADGSLVSVVFAQTPGGFPPSPPIAGASFSPWGAWPSTLGPVAHVFDLGGGTIVAAPAMPAEQPGFSVVVHWPNDSVPTPTAVATAAPGQSYEIPNSPALVAWDSWEPSWAVALARGTSGHLELHEDSHEPTAFLHAVFVDHGTLSTAVLGDVACGADSFPADVTAVDGGYLLATAAGTPFGTCLSNAAPIGPPKDLQIMRVDEATQHLSLAASFAGIDPIAYIAVARRAQGAWVLWQENGASALTPPPIQAALLDETGAAAGPMFPVAATAGTLGPFAAVALGSRLVVAWIDSLDPSTPTIHLQVLDEKGTALGGTSVNTAPSWLYQASLSLLASPDGTQLLLAWADQAQPEQAMARVTRFLCTAIGE